MYYLTLHIYTNNASMWYFRGGGVTVIESWQGCAAEEFNDPPFYTGVLASKWHPFVRNLESTTPIFLDIPWFILFIFSFFIFFWHWPLWTLFCTEGRLISHPFVRKSIFKNVPFSAAHPVSFDRGVTTPRWYYLTYLHKQYFDVVLPYLDLKAGWVFNDIALHNLSSLNKTTSIWYESTCFFLL